jgi:hypothetical protein
MSHQLVTHPLNSKKSKRQSGMKHEPSARSTHHLNSKKSKKVVRARNMSHQLDVLTF